MSMTWNQTDEHYMLQALAAARRSAALGEVPVGALLVRRSADAVGHETVLACTHNQPIGRCDPTAHAEVLALREAAGKLGNYRLDDCDLYVTLEPCAMCAQAMLHARIRRVVFGAREPKTGAAGSVLDLFALRELNHHTEVIGGVLAEECASLMSDFFLRRRAQARQAAVPLRPDALRTPERRFSLAWELFPGLRSSSRHESGLLELEGLRLHGIDTGPVSSSEAWLALHGPQAWWPQLAGWALERQAAGQRVLLPDLIGFGQSDKPKKPGWHSLDRHASLLLAWVRSRGVTAVNVTYAINQIQLARRMIESEPKLIKRMVPQADEDLFILPDELKSAPYPDAGHMAGWRAWRENGWDS